MPGNRIRYRIKNKEIITATLRRCKALTRPFIMSVHFGRCGTGPTARTLRILVIFSGHEPSPQRLPLT